MAAAAQAAAPSLPAPVPATYESSLWAAAKAGLYSAFISGPKNLSMGALNALNAVPEFAYYVRDVAVLGADTLVTGAGALTGQNWSLGVQEWSSAGISNQPSNPNFWSNATWNAGRAGLGGLTAGGSEIIIGTGNYLQTGNAAAFQQQMGGLAASNLAGAASIKLGQSLKTTNQIKTPGGRTLTSHAADRMTNPPRGRAPMTLAEVDQVLDTANRIKKISAHPEGNTITVQNTKMPGKPQVVVDAATGKRVITVIKNKR